MAIVSVIIPTHNRCEYLKSAIQSVLNQSYQDFEIIVVNDASTDATDEVLTLFDDPRINYIRHESNKGGAATRNTGIQRACGEFLAFLDDDDEWLPEKLALQVSLMSKSLPKVGVVYSGFKKVDRASGEVILSVLPTKKGNLSADLLRNNCVGTTSSVLIRKECFEKVGLFDEALPSAQDFDLWIRISREFHFECIKEPLLKYYLHEIKIGRNLEAAALGMDRIWMKHGKYCSRLKTNFGYTGYLRLGTFSCLEGKAQEGRAAYIKAITAFPIGMKAIGMLCLSILDKETLQKLLRIKSALPF